MRHLRAEGAQISYQGYRMGLVLDVGRSNAPGARQVIRHREVVLRGSRFLARRARINCYSELVGAADQIKLAETICDCLSRKTSVDR